MGYTRYWRRPREFDAVQFAAFAQASRDIGNEYLDVLARCECDNNRVFLEGRPGCEHFAIQRISDGRVRDGFVSEYCKTQGLPYDAAIERILALLAEHFPEVELPPPS